jgi:chromosome segregation ATPase
MDTVQIVAIASAVSGIIGILATKGVDALIRWRKASNETCTLEDERADRVYSTTIARQSARIEKLESGYTELRKEHEACLQTAARQSAEIHALERDTQRMQEQIDKLMMRHDRGDQ